ncbi:MAG: Na+/H+ antiporter subunit E [Syntrophales bacterium]|nr:Na+/H+ antiporter subunit E [Syntrophales bacterium]MCK9528144.1 Na+/H+ antiporter subunit E [Syntrophales bacterium]MDX9921114.1 Na+/H+ antiporter subunit E [Syntrophales bacterium]
MKNNPHPPKNNAVLLLLMMAFWLVMSGYFDVFHISMGVISVALVFWLDRKLLRERFYPAAEKRPQLRLGYFHFSYFPWMVWQIIQAALHVARVILTPGDPLNMSLVRFRTRLPSNTSRVILANSITLTPGTLTIDLVGDEFLVHALTDQSSEGIINSDMPDRVGKLYDPDGGTMMIDYDVLRADDF